MKKSDSPIEHLEDKEAVQKMKNLVDNTRVCLFTTNLDQIPLQTRPMATLAVDDEGTFWFLSDEHSHKNLEIHDDARVQLFYSNPGKSEFMTVYGHAMVSTDRSKIEKLWSPMAGAWFKGGKNDPSLSVLMVLPEQAYYWDTKHGKMISFLKILASTVTEKSMDDGRQGRLEI